MGMVRYGLKNVHVAEYDTTTKTYGDWIAIPGAVSLSIDVSADQNDFYADNVVYATISPTIKESGSIEFAALTEEIATKVFGYVKDATSGLTYESTKANNKTFALGYEISGNESEQRGVRYNVSFTPPSQSANTMADSTDPDTVTLDLTAIGRDFTIGDETVNVLKAHVDSSEDSTAYTKFFDSVVVPGVAVA